VRFVRDGSGRRVQMYGDRPSKLAFTRESAPQTPEELERLAATGAPQSGDETQAKPGDGGARALRGPHAAGAAADPFGAASLPGARRGPADQARAARD